MNDAMRPLVMVQETEEAAKTKGNLKGKERGEKEEEGRVLENA